MITRGFLIGEIVDHLTTIRAEIEQRAKLGLTDINKFAEDFFKTIINKTYGYNLINLNSERSNEPGLDLGDMKKSIAFQVTSRANKAKIENTYKKITPKQINDFKEIKFFVAGWKQGTVSIDQNLLNKFNFDHKKTVIDIDDLLMAIVPLEIDRLREVYDYVSKETTRIRAELEIPDKEGKYKTNLDGKLEKRQEIQISECIDFHACFSLHETVDAVKVNVMKISQHLQKLPRLTREYLAYMLDQAEFKDDQLKINSDKLCKLSSNYPDYESDIRILVEDEYIYLSDLDDNTHARYWSFNLQCEIDDMEAMLDEYVEKQKTTWRKMIVSIDFSDL